MNFSYVIKAIIISFFVFAIIYSLSFVSTQNLMLNTSNYGIKNSLKESINLAEYRINQDIVFNEEELVKNVIKNYAENNNIKVDEIEFEVYLNEETNIVTVKINTMKKMFNSDSKANNTFSYQITKRGD